MNGKSLTLTATPISHPLPPVSAVPIIHVACGVLINPQGEVLLAQRPEGKVAAGWWEFPGGKIEAGETALAALTRELHEELGVTVRVAEPLIRFRHAYTNRTVILDTWRVSGFEGVPRSLEGQALRWLPVARFAELSPLLPTVEPIQRALTLPRTLVFTPPVIDAAALLAGLPHLPARCLLRLRCPGLGESAYSDLARTVLLAATALGIAVLLDRDPAQVAALGAAGWYATSAALMRCAERPAAGLALASVHDAPQLAQAQSLGFDAAVLGPVQPTASHPGAPTLGWPGFAALRADLPLPVYAIGGVGAEDWPAARAANAQGFAGISAYWRGSGG